MQTVTVGGKDFTVRGLTWGEKKRLKRDLNIDLSNMGDNALDGVDGDALIETILATVGIEEDQYIDLETFDVLTLFQAVMKATFVGPGEAKN